MATPSARERTHTFLLIRYAGKPDRVIVWDTQDVSLGRSPENDVEVDHSEVSRRHAVFTRSGATCTVADLGTSNGTYVNGDRIRTQALQSGDVVRVGDVELVFHHGPQNPASLGHKLEYASQLKSFGGPQMGGNAEATMLGLGLDDTASGDGDFEVRPAGDFDCDLQELEGGLDTGPAPQARDLDLELDGFGMEDLEEPPPPRREAPAPPPAAAPAPTRPPVEARPAPAPAAAAPTPAAAVPTPAERAAPNAPGSASADGFWTLEESRDEPRVVSLHVEIAGLTPDLRAALRALCGKVIELPSLHLRIKDEDL